MKKIICLFSFALLLTIFAASAVSAAVLPDPYTEFNDNTLIVYGNSAFPEDYQYCLDKLKESTSNQIKKDTEVTADDKSTKNLILIGNPYINRLVLDLSQSGKTATQDDWRNNMMNQYMVQKVSNAYAVGKNALIIAGSETDKTKEACDHVFAGKPPTHTGIQNPASIYSISAAQDNKLDISVENYLGMACTAGCENDPSGNKYLVVLLDDTQTEFELVPAGSSNTNIYVKGSSIPYNANKVKLTYSGTKNSLSLEKEIPASVLSQLSLSPPQNPASIYSITAQGKLDVSVNAYLSMASIAGSENDPTGAKNLKVFIDGTPVAFELSPSGSVNAQIHVAASNIPSGAKKIRLEYAGSKYVFSLDDEIPSAVINQLSGTPPTICTDSDSGKNYYVKSDVRGESGSIIYYDYCANDKTLYEAYCDGTNYAQEIYSCPNGCNDGACMSDTNKGSCTDSDGGVDIYVKGKVVDKGHPGTFAAEDKCLSNIQILEYSCKNDAWYANYVDCSNICQDGACISDTDKKSCTDSDSGMEYFIKGTTKDTVSDSKTDFCYSNTANPEAGSSDGNGKYVMEYFCNGASLEGIAHECPVGCKDGACIVVKEIVVTPRTENAEKEPVIMPENDDINKVLYVCDGCSKENNCYPIGYRMSGQYCTPNKGFLAQLSTDTSCENNFECESNFCASGKCISGDFLQKIVDWFKKFFGM